MPSIIVEAGHIYTNEHPALEHRAGAELGHRLSDLFALGGVDVKKWVLIDDYNPQFDDGSPDLDVDSYLLALHDWGFAPHEVVRESSLVPAAAEILEQMLEGNIARQRSDGRVFLRESNIRLYDAANGRYACALLDACLYRDKLGHADMCVTVLDRKYAPEQKRTLAIGKHMGINAARIFPFFYANTFAQQSIGHGSDQPAFDLLHTAQKVPGRGEYDV